MLSFPMMVARCRRHGPAIVITAFVQLGCMVVLLVAFMLVIRFKIAMIIIVVVIVIRIFVVHCITMWPYTIVVIFLLVVECIGIVTIS